MKKHNILLTAAAVALTMSVVAAQSGWSLHPMETAAGTTATPHGLKLEGVDDRQVTLSWLSPEAIDGLWEDFESHDDFAINSAGEIGWQYLDGDNRTTTTWNAGTFPGQGSKMAFIVFNGSEMSLAEGLDMSTNKNFQPVSGRKMLLDFSAIGSANNDYIISPELHFDEDFQISFMARSYTVAYGAERVRVGYSTTGKRQSDFTFLTARATDNGTLSPRAGRDYLELPAAWTLIQYNVPAEARYVCVNCVSDDAFMFMLDDLFVGTNRVRPDRTPAKAAQRNRLEGFNIYRNGERINAETYVSEIFKDEVPDYGTYTYSITAVYADGTESAPSEPLEVKVNDITQLPFEDDFSTLMLHPDKWSTPADTQDNESRWAAGYYEYGLVNRSAVYSYSMMRYYDQSLVSRELRTFEPDNTWLRFVLQHVCYTFNGVDYLDVEVKGLNETDWHKVASYTNEQGSFDRTMMLCSLGEHLKDANEGRFQVRFRAHGSDAQYIDYWYLDDVKVWNPVWSRASLRVLDGQTPMADITVRLEGRQGMAYTAVSDAEGRIELPQVEVDTYQVSVSAEGYNRYETVLAVSQAPAAFDICLTKPQLTLSATLVTVADMATESSAQQTLTLRNEGTGPAIWQLSQTQAAGSGSVAHRFELGPTFTLSGDLQSSIVFDGEHFYAGSWYFLGKFYKYDREGRFLEEFSIPEMYYRVYDFAYDGRYVYASDYSNRIFQLDMDEKRIVRIIDIPELPNLQITHLAYDPDRDGFWCGTFNTLVLIDRQGKQMAMEMQWEFAAFGSAYDNITPGGPYLWVSDMTLPDDIIIDKVMLRQYDLNKRAFTGVSHVVNDMPGYRCGNEQNGQNQVCGVTITDQLVPGQLTLVGSLQQSPSLVYTYNICDYGGWMQLSPVRGELQPGQEQEVTIRFSSLEQRVGEERHAQLILQTKPSTQSQTIGVSMQVTHATSVPRPQQLQAEVGQGQVTLKWQGNDQATAYEVVRDGQTIATVQGTEYTDQGVTYGSYVYNIRAIYAAGSSLMSDQVTAFVKQGAPYYAPTQLQAQIANNRDVELQWQSPLANVGTSATLMWGTGHNDDQLGVGTGYFYAGQRWTAEDLIPYRNKTITAVKVRICSPVRYLAARVYQDGKLVARTVHSGSVTYDDYTEIRLQKPVSIVPGCEYIVCVQVQAEDGMRPLAMDEDTHYDGRGNLISLDGTNWYNASQTAITGNFNLGFTVEPSEAELQEAAPSAYRIYCDGQPMGTTAALTYSTTVEQPGLHTFTVTSLYGETGESKPSEPATAQVLNIVNRQAPDTIGVSVARNRFVSLGWSPAPSATLAGAHGSFPVDLGVQRHTTRKDYPGFLNAWQTVGTEMGVTCDGRYVYTSVFNETGHINVYSLTGQYLGKVNISDPMLGGIRNLAWDGQHLWAADNSTSIHCLNIMVEPSARGYNISGEVVKTYSIAEYSRHLAYIPDLNDGEGGFEVGDWQTSILVTTTGAKLGNGPAYNAASGTAYHDGRIYAFEQANPLNSHSVAVYDSQTHQSLMVIDLEQYAELSGLEEGFAGGASAFRTADGMTILALCMQFGDRPSQLVFLDLSGSEGVAGYNVYRDGQLMMEHTTLRSYTDTLTVAGDYAYTVSTCYIDGTESLQSAPHKVTILPAEEVEVPASVQAQPAAYPYNVNLSFADPYLFDDVAMAEDFEDGAIGTSFVSDRWSNTFSTWIVSDVHYTGSRGLLATAEDEAWLVVPMAENRWLSFVARSEAQPGASGRLEVYYSLGGDNVNDFIPLDEYATTTCWQQFDIDLPEGTEYVLLRKSAECKWTQYLDAMRLNPVAPASRVYGYEIYRNGRCLTPEPLTDISYTDHNLAQGEYRYEVRLVSSLSSVSAFAEPAVIDLRYDNGGQAPVNVCANVLPDSSAVELTWEAPAIGQGIDLAWHDGRNHDAAGLSDGGAYWAAVRWAPSDLVGCDSLSVSAVEVYVNQVPDALYIMLYEGTELKRQQLVERPQQYAFNRIMLQEPLPLNTQRELRLVVYVEHNNITVPLGYDAGPCVADGKSNLYSGDGVTWSRLSDEGTEINANWDFGIVLQPYELANAEAGARSRAACRAEAPLAPYAASETTLNALRGYHVYVNRELQQEELMLETSYLDSEVRLHVPYLEYQVKAVYSRYGEVSAPMVRIQNPMQTPRQESARGEVNGIEQLKSDAEAAMPRYNLQGQRIRSASGFVIERGRVVLED